MTTTNARLRDALQRFAFAELFTQELGWNRGHGKAAVVVRGAGYELAIVAEKRGVQVLLCPPEEGGRIPTADVRAAIDREVTKHAYEHLIIFEDAKQTEQIWLYPKREPGRPVRLITYRFDSETTNELLLQKLSAISFSLGEEETLTLFEVTSRLKETLDRDKLTKTFYQAFSAEREAFQEFLKGIPDAELERWYVAVLMNRLMFIYFVQEKGFLDGNQRYLQARLESCKGNYYRDVLCPLFFRGFATPEADRPAAIRKALGRIPYLNGGIFQKHEIEELHGKTIEIPNNAFEKLFAFFDRWRWHLDERPLAAGNEINPDVLGYIFEKYVNQKQMGAYYTKEDITEYISKSTVLPFLLDAARAKCKVAFENPGGPTVWDLLRDDPDRYIYTAMRHGVCEPLPAEVAQGLNPPTLHDPVGEGPVLTLELRKQWGKAAPRTHALPTETWREHVTRRQRYEEVSARLAAGDVRDVNDLITLNLDIRQFAQDLIENCEGPDLLRAIWHAIEKVTVLDPTCGSGAFLFAALNILEPLYEACLVRMEAFLEDLERSGEKHRPEKLSDFRKILLRVGAHPNRRYFIFKSIILSNLYGVDIMEEAVEICKLRLFLKLAAQVEPDPAKPNLGIEPLPDIDFNIRAGNSLVGYATLDEVRHALASRLDLDNAADPIVKRAADLQQAFDAFRERQTAGDASVPERDKRELDRRLRAVGGELNAHLATAYGVPLMERPAYDAWLASHRPFNWCVEFYGIMSRGGFDVVVGNPPFVEYSKVRDEYEVTGFQTEECGNLYVYVVERAWQLMHSQSRLGLIAPLGGFSTARMKAYQNLVATAFPTLHIIFLSSDAHPSVLFDGVKYRLAFLLGSRRAAPESAVWTTSYTRWYAEERSTLLTAKVQYCRSPFSTGYLRFAKLGMPVAHRTLSKILRNPLTLEAYARKGGRGVLHYHRSPVFWIRAMNFEPFFKSATRTRSDDHLRDLYYESEAVAAAVGGVLNSSTFFAWFIAQGNCRDVAGPDIDGFPIGRLKPATLKELQEGCAELSADLRAHSRRRTYNYRVSGKVEYEEFYPRLSKSLIDVLDYVLARHYGLTEEELDFIVNYDIKYRMGADADGEAEEE